LADDISDLQDLVEEKENGKEKSTKPIFIKEKKKKRKKKRFCP